MSNYVLVCHGNILESSSFELADGQELQYRGNFGAPLGYGTALAIWKALKSDPTISDRNLKKGNSGYDPQEPLVGPGGFGPDIALSGDDRLFLFLINMTTGNYIRLGSGWSIRLKQLVTMLGENGKKGFWLNLMCCTQQEGSGIEPPEGAHLVSKFESII